MNGPKLIGRYEIVAEIGRGAMGSVFKARDPAVGRIVALKTVHASALASEQSEEFRARFYREARASGVLAHPGIVPVFDVGEHEGAPFLVMEFVDGRTLGEAIKKGERFTLDRVCEIGHQMGDALGYAHRQGVIHRDVKPANILMTSREVYGSERPRITDFGIAKLTSVDITTTGQVLGTPSYMAPELLAGSPADGRCDIFSLGVILYALTAGELPFAGETLMAVSYKITHVEAIPPSKLNPAVSPGLEAVILKALAKRPDTRYQTCEELVLDLAAIRAGTSPAALSSIPAAPIDANATLAPGNRTPLPGAAQISAAATPTPASTSAASKPAAGPGEKKPGKPVQVETIFAVILLAIAGLGTAGAGAWFVFTHVLSFAHRQHQESTTSVSQPPSPAQPVVQIPQPIATAPSQDQTQPPATPGTTPAAPPSPEANPAATAPNPQVSTAAKPASGKPKPGTQKSPASAQPPSGPNATVAKSGPNPANPSAAAGPVAAAPSASPISSPAATKPSTAFDPRKLDPNTSTKLKIEPSKMPNGLPVNVDMDKKPYLSFVTGDKTDLDNLYIPAGTHAFSVQVKSGGQAFDSNALNDTFKAKKKKTLKIEIQQNGNPLPSPTVPLPKDAQVNVSFPFVLSDVF